MSGCVASDVCDVTTETDHPEGEDNTIDVINVYNVYKKIFVNAFIILSTFISIKIT